MSLSAIETKVVSILKDPDLKTINFSINDIPVWGDAFEMIADAITNRRIFVFENTQLTKHGRYRIRQDNNGSLELPASLDYTSNPSAHALVVHEAVHCLADYRASPLQRLDDESAAYLAQMMFFIIKGINVLNHISDDSLFNLSIVLDPIARRILTTTGGYNVTIEEYNRIRRQVHQYVGGNADVWKQYNGI